MADSNFSEALDYHERGRPGKIEIRPTKPTATQADLSLAYSPGVAEPCLASAAEPLSKALGDSNWWVRLRAAIALRRLGDAGSEHLTLARDGDDRFAAEMASYAMGLSEAAVQDYLS